MASYALAAVMDSEVRKEAEKICAEVSLTNGEVIRPYFFPGPSGSRITIWATNEEEANNRLTNLKSLQ